MNKIIFPADYLKHYYLRTIPEISKNKTHVVPCFVEDTEETKAVKGNGSNYFIYVGRLAEEKGVLDLLAVFSQLPQIRLVVVGDGPLRNQCKIYQKYKNIMITDFLVKKQIYEYLRKAHCMIMPSLSPWQEGGPLVLFEAFANRIPVIAPQAGVFLERIVSKRTGIFYEFNNFDDLKKKIVYVNENRRLIRNMGIFARKEYEKKYSAEAHYQSLIRLYKSTITKQKI